MIVNMYMNAVSMAAQLYVVIKYNIFTYALLI